MIKARIQLVYRQVIDSTVSEKLSTDIWNVSYNEFLLKCQAYNPGGIYKTFSEMKAANGQADSLHHTCGFAACGYLKLLQNAIPGLADNMGRSLRFIQYQFELIESDIHSRDKHVIAISYQVEPLILSDSLGEALLLAMPGQQEHEEFPVNTFVLRMNIDLSITEISPGHTTLYCDKYLRGDDNELLNSLLKNQSV